MFRAFRPRGEDSPPGEAMPTSLESLLALSLCGVVLLASVAFLRRSSDLSRAIAGLSSDDLRPIPARPRRPEHTAQDEPRPELVILISLDTLRADRLELYGYGRTTAPNLSALAAEGVLFRTVCAQSTQTLTSHKSLFTGKYPATLMLEETGADLLELTGVSDAREYLVDTFRRVKTRLAAGFSEAGYRTAGFTDGAWMSREAGFDTGFETFDDAGGGLASILPRGLAWLAADVEHPSFLFLHAYDVHCPYTSPEPYDSAFCPDHAAHIRLDDKCGKGALSGIQLTAADLAALTDHYDGGILSADALLGGFFRELRARGLYDRALIVVTSDHGESLGERGAIGHGGLYLEQLLVPLILKPPLGWKLPTASVEEPVELVDLLPTLCALCSIPVGGDLDGRSLLPTLYRGVRGRDYLVAQTSFEEAPALRSSPAKRTLLRPGRWQVIHDVDRSEAEFFALDQDPRGLSAHSIRPDEFSPLLDVLLERAPGGPRAVLRAAPPVAFSPELLHELDHLGYGAATLAGQPVERNRAGR